MKKADVQEFIALHAAAAISEKRMKELREILLPQLRAGEQSPPDLPCLLELRNQERTTRDYKSPLLALLIRKWGKSAGERKLELIEAKFEKTNVEQLCVVANKQLLAQPALEQLRTA